MSLRFLKLLNEVMNKKNVKIHAGKNRVLQRKTNISWSRHSNVHSVFLLLRCLLLLLLQVELSRHAKTYFSTYTRTDACHIQTLNSFATTRLLLLLLWLLFPFSVCFYKIQLNCASTHKTGLFYPNNKCQTQALISASSEFRIVFPENDFVVFQFYFIFKCHIIWYLSFVYYYI